MEFRYTYLPVNEDKSPELPAGFKYDQFRYGDDWRREDTCQSGHVTHPNTRLFVIDVDDLGSFLDTHLGQLLTEHGLLPLVTYRSASDKNKRHLYFADPEELLDPSDYPKQWASKFCYDVKSNGFVRAEPAYQWTDFDPYDIGSDIDLLFAMHDAIEADKTAYRETTRRAKPESQSAWTGELRWEDWHTEDGQPVEDYTCDYEDALRMAGQLRNWYEFYESALREFCTATYDSEGYTGDETWEQTFERLWNSMAVKDGKTLEVRAREDEQVLGTIDPDGSGRDRAVEEARKKYEDFQNTITLSEPGKSEAAPEDDEGYASAYFPDDFPATDSSLPTSPENTPRDTILKYAMSQGMGEETAREWLKDPDVLRSAKQQAFKWALTGAGVESSGKTIADASGESWKSILAGSNGRHDLVKLGESFVVKRGSVGSIVAQSHVGKTTFACAATVQIVQNGGRVVWMIWDGDPSGPGQLMLSMGLSEDQLVESVPVVQFPDKPKSKADAEELAKLWGGADLVVMDNMNTIIPSWFPGSSENDNSVPPVIMGTIGRGIAAAGPAVMILDNLSTKGEVSLESLPTGARGASAKYDSADWIYTMLKKGNGFSGETDGSVDLVVSKDKIQGRELGTVIGTLKRQDGEFSLLGADKEETSKTVEFGDQEYQDTKLGLASWMKANWQEEHGEDPVTASEVTAWVRAARAPFMRKSDGDLKSKKQVTDRVLGGSDGILAQASAGSYPWLKRVSNDKGSGYAYEWCMKTPEEYAGEVEAVKTEQLIRRAEESSDPRMQAALKAYNSATEQTEKDRLLEKLLSAGEEG